ncbi:MAG: DUF4124 domain-containing protein [Gammaproteobacteria bacterium]|nr:DUF4124 domain-containing protein [Gammaproteobacteria bacterium]
MRSAARSALAAALVALTPWWCGAEETVSVYRSTGEQGETVYSDEYRPGAKRIEVVVPTGIATATPALSAPSAGSAQDGGAGYEHFSIAEPAGGVTIRANSGNVPVVLDVEPALREGDRIRIDLDGEVRELGSTSTLLRDVPRGAHRLSAVIVGADGRELAAAGPVEFQLLRVSRLTKPPGPDVPGGAVRQ